MVSLPGLLSMAAKLDPVTEPHSTGVPTGHLAQLASYVRWASEILVVSCFGLQGRNCTACFPADSSDRFAPTFRKATYRCGSMALHRGGSLGVIFSWGGGWIKRFFREKA